MKKKIPQLVSDDLWLEPYTDEISNRIARFEEDLISIEKEYGSLEEFAGGYMQLGIHYDQENNGWWYREWAPGADALSLFGDFNNWDTNALEMKKLKTGEFTCLIELEKGKTYEFRYLVNGKDWVNDLEADSYVSNKFGVENCVVEAV